MADRPRKTVDIFIDPRFSASQRKALGNEFIKYIRSRTKKGNGKGNTPFKQTSEFKGGRKNQRTYADSYIDHQDFKTAGKKPRPINIELSGDTIDSVEVVDVSLPGRVTIGFKKAGDESDKAWYNEEKGYDFLAMSKDEVNGVVSKAGGIKPGDTQAVSESVAQRIARRLFGDN